jgi:hypothetical protein
MGWGGNTNSLPNHLQDLTFWNRAHTSIEPGRSGCPLTPRLHHPLSQTSKPLATRGKTLTGGSTLVAIPIHLPPTRLSASSLV